MKKRIIYPKAVCLLLAVFLTVASAGCNAKSVTRSDYLLDTFVTVTLYGSGDREALDGAIGLCAYYDAMLDRHSEDSEVYRLNHADGIPTEVSPDLAEIITIALRYCAISDGRYDITIAPVMDLWDFQSRQSVPPSDDAVSQALSQVDWRNVSVSGNIVTLSNGAMIDLGSIAKGYIADKMGEYLKEQGVKSAIINLGGNVLTVGGKPGGRRFSIGIQRPFEDGDKFIGSVQVKDTSAVSSGVYERYFFYDSVLYHHILNANTGYPSDSDLLSVTVLCEKSVDCDALSTLCFLLGKEDGLALIESIDGAEAIFVEADGSVLTSGGVVEKYRYRAESQEREGYRIGALLFCPLFDRVTE